jgi:PPOX class probable F420-dependent enzyme
VGVAGAAGDAGNVNAAAAAWTHPELARELVAWLGTTGPDGQAALVPTWFAWDGTAFLVASKPGARKVRNVRANSRVMLGITRVGVEMESQLVEGHAEVLDGPAAVAAFDGCDLSRYDGLLAADGITRDAFFARYSAVIRVVPTRFLPWQGPGLARAVTATVPGSTSRGRRDGVRTRLLQLVSRLASRPAYGAVAA